MTDKPNFEIAIEAEYCTNMINAVEKILEEKLPDYTRHKILIIKLIDIV